MTLNKKTLSIATRFTAPISIHWLGGKGLKPNFRSIIRFCLAIIAVIAVSPLGLRAQTDSCPVPPEQTSNPPIGVLNDYIYGYAPVTLKAIRALLTAAPDATTKPGRAPINQFARQDKLADPSENLIVHPNADTLYTTAWLDLADEPIILHVPDTNGRYYLIPMLDAYSNEFASVGSRATGNGEGNFAIVGPRWRGELPQGLSGVIQAPTNTAWLIGRTLVHGQEDLSAALTVTTKYQLVPLSAYPKFLETCNYTPPTNVSVNPPDPDFIGLPISSSPGFSNPEFFNALAAYALRNPAPRDQEPLASLLVLDGFIHQNQLNQEIVNQARCAFIARLADSSEMQNGWSKNLNVGNYGKDYTLRGAVALFGLGANVPADSVYANALVDLNGNTLDGNNLYAIHFPAGQTPPVNGFWSVTVYDKETGFLVHNPIQRYSVGSETGLVPNADGSVDILLQSTPPSSLQSNWLPTPAKPFTLTLRLYWPAPAVLDGSWTIPGVNPVCAN
jgi:hypothetical protein